MGGKTRAAAGEAPQQACRRLLQQLRLRCGPRLTARCTIFAAAAACLCCCCCSLQLQACLVQRALPGRRLARHGGLSLEAAVGLGCQLRPRHLALLQLLAQARQLCLQPPYLPEMAGASRGGGGGQD